MTRRMRPSGMPQVIDLFAGPGGWSVACRRLHLDETGIEIDPTACRTRKAAGFDTVEGSVTDYGPADFPECVGLIASPPCQLFSTAGKGAARKLMPEILEAIAAMGRGDKPDTSGWPDGAKLVLEPLRWAIEAINLGRPYEWIALEQVPPVLPVWAAMADVLRHGYGVATGNLQAEMYGVPQTRKRAILVARLDGSVSLPRPTHSRYYPRDPQRLDPGVTPWISMAQALGWSGPGTFVSNYSSGSRDDSSRNVMPIKRPSPVVTGNIGRARLVPFEITEPPVSMGEVDLMVEAWVRSNYSAPSRYPGQTAAQRGKDMRSADLPPAPTIAFGHDSASAGWLFDGAGKTAVDTAGQQPRAAALPAHTITGKGTATWVGERPATTVNGDARIAQPGRHDPAVSGSQYGAETVRVSVQEAAILQSFPADYPWAGDPDNPNSRTSQYQRVGDAIPPLLAEAVLRAVTEVR